MENPIYKPTYAITVISMLVCIYHQCVISEYIQAMLKTSTKRLKKNPAKFLAFLEHYRTELFSNLRVSTVWK